jgi:hypothetical protein
MRVWHCFPKALRQDELGKNKFARRFVHSPREAILSTVVAMCSRSFFSLSVQVAFRAAKIVTLSRHKIMLVHVTNEASLLLHRISARRSRKLVFTDLILLSSVRLAARVEVPSSSSGQDPSSHKSSMAAALSQLKGSRCFCLAWQMAAKVVICDSVSVGNRHTRWSSVSTEGIG